MQQGSEPPSPKWGDHKTQEKRTAHERTGEWLRRARRHYCALVRKWVEAEETKEGYLERLAYVASRCQEAGLYSKKSQALHVMFGILGHWAKADGRSRWPWTQSDPRRRQVDCRLKKRHTDEALRNYKRKAS